MAETITTKTEKQTRELGQQIARRLRSGDIVCLEGNLGSGKTTMTKGIAEGLAIDPDALHSPTFIVMNRLTGKLPLFHFDLYRLHSENDLFDLGYEEFFYGEGVCVIEWADKLDALRPEECLWIMIDHAGSAERAITLQPHGKRYETLLKDLKIKR